MIRSRNIWISGAAFVLFVGVAAALAYLVPYATVAWIPVFVGAAWTIALTVADYRLRRNAGAGVVVPRSLRSAAIACGLLTAFLVSFTLRERVGWPELTLGLLANVVLFRWFAHSVAEAGRRVPPPRVLRA